MQQELLDVVIAKIKDDESRRFGKNESRFKIRSAVFFLIAVCLSLVIVVIWSVWSARQYRLHDQEVAMSNLAQTLSSQAQAAIKQADTVLFGLVERLEVDGMSQVQIPRIRRVLKAQRTELAQLHGLFIYDEEGLSFASSNGIIPPTSYADRDYFLYHREHPDRGPHIGPSIRSRSTGDWVIPVSRRVNHPDGRFAGVVVASLYLNHFLHLYNSVDIGDNGVINLMSADARIMVRRPFKETEVGSDVSKGPVFTQLLPTGNFGTGIVKSYVDGVERVVGFRRIDEYPLVIFAAQNKDEILAPWRRQSLFSAGIVVFLLAILGVLGGRLIRLMKRQNHVQNELLGTQKKLLEANGSLELLALEDALTGLANRRQFDLFLKSEMRRAMRSRGSLSLLMIDVDHFKRFNDHYGHLMGDECLRTISTMIQENIRRPGDLAARYGGEEFAVILPNTDYVGAFLVAEKIRHAVQKAKIPHVECPEGAVTISLGVSTCILATEKSPNDLIGAADKALYVAKTTGRNMSVIAADCFPLA